MAVARGFGWVHSRREWRRRLARPHLNACGLALDTPPVPTSGTPNGSDWYTGLSAVALLRLDWASMNKGVKQATHTMPDIHMLLLSLQRRERLLARSGLIEFTMIECSPVKS
ncbi:hypothetical protein JI435_403940 [Parastagonospora nodorum SN15]|uniref:Uncharacterized protein n=1 Tax=Phaeosphaeria nodorum (strain SN15 / ATCC MYA-4574 / FGSC 10173) TaxID=321614 RepID=A0A7U2HVK7_PHANO|nr:hypothetical protein HBI50_058770 [Parastagonospora nodorum]QRC93495.1 hypothetical protein JI435_403940 [Parastagonospora nodorum SN15]KAH5511545.1 hypothetical protein HBI31_027430 [Parastagonospora nodorum]KAH5657092.1 hypothetical protein HBI51_031570 [Parastagonospora nodorum]KAH6044804.1 hypothetical protein HBI54_100120 [Parastagonospora nodorum]